MLKEPIRNGRRPLKFDTLKLKNKVLYDLLNDKKIELLRVNKRAQQG
jgi:hypothetical protein